MNKEERQLQELGMVVHGILATLHLVLGVPYNLRRKNWTALGIHLLAGSYSLKSVWEHYKALEEWDGKMHW